MHRWSRLSSQLHASRCCWSQWDSLHQWPQSAPPSTVGTALLQADGRARLCLTATTYHWLHQLTCQSSSPVATFPTPSLHSLRTCAQVSRTAKYRLSTKVRTWLAINFATSLFCFSSHSQAFPRLDFPDWIRLWCVMRQHHLATLLDLP